MIVIDYNLLGWYEYISYDSNWWIEIVVSNLSDVVTHTFLDIFIHM